MAPMGTTTTATTTSPVVVPASFSLEAAAVALGAEQPTKTLSQCLEEAERSFTLRNPASKAAHEHAQQFLPGGNTRSVLFNRPFPICAKRGSGNRLWDVDDNQYLDFLGEMTAGIYGHSNGAIRRSVMSTWENVGVNLGAHTLGEVKLASLICDRFPAVEQLRFCNSGTEANIYALSIARHVTGKRKVIAFKGGYHGGVLGFAHGGVGPNNVDPEDWIIGDYNDEDALASLFQAHADGDVAAVIVEAMQGAGGCIPGSLSFLQKLQSYAAQHKIVFILDEVMTSRLHPSGLHGKYGLQPDLVTLGKYIGGGFAIGVFGGRKDLLATYDPRPRTTLPHSGTFNNNTLAMEAGHVAMSQVYTPQANTELNEMGAALRAKVASLAKGTKMVVTGMGAVMNFHFQHDGTVPVCEQDLERHSVPELKKLFWYWCLEHGYWIAERGMLSLVLGTTAEEVDAFVTVVGGFLSRYRALLELSS